MWMATILGSTFFGISVLAHRLRPTVSENETLLSIMGKAVFGSGSVFYFVLQFSTFAILILAANTAYADFPRLSSIIAQRRLPAAPAREPRRPPRVLERRARARGRSDPADHRVRRQDLRPDPALCRRRVHRLHAVADGHGRPPSQAQRAAMEVEARDQRRRRGGDGHRPHRRRRVEVHDRRVDPRRADPADRHGAQGDRTALQARRARDDDRARVEAAPLHTQRRRARRPAQQAHPPSAHVRALARARPARAP